MRVYQSEISAISDSEISTLMEELVDAGVLNDPYSYDEEDWIRQAYDRYCDFDRELVRRRQAANPDKSTGSSASIIAAQMEAARPRLAELFEHSTVIAQLIRKQGVR